MPRTNRPSRVDANQAEIVRALREQGATVTHLHAVGHGVPDLLVGWAGMNYLVEVKDGKGKLTPDETEWHQEWRGQVVVIRSYEEAFQFIERERLG